MPFHFFGPPHAHFLALHLTAALGAAAAAYYVFKNGMPVGVARAGANIKERAASWRANGCAKECSGGSTMFARSRGRSGSTGNRAFDEYRDETLQKLEREAAEFRSYVEGLRGAKDKAEFDRFMAERKAGGASSGESAS